MLAGPAALALVTVCANAQTTLGQIAGNVTDSSGAVIPGAMLTITQIGTQIIHKAMTDQSGFYVVTNLPIGDYTVAVSKTGFTSEKRTGITITADAHVTADFQVKVGAAAEVVSVSATASEALNTTSGELAHVVDTKEVEIFL